MDGAPPPCTEGIRAVKEWDQSGIWLQNSPRGKGIVQWWSSEWLYNSPSIQGNSAVKYRSLTARIPSVQGGPSSLFATIIGRYLCIFFTVSPFAKVPGKVVGFGQNKNLLWECDHWTKERLWRDKLKLTTLYNVQFDTLYPPTGCYASRRRSIIHHNITGAPHWALKAFSWLARYHVFEEQSWD